MPGILDGEVSLGDILGSASDEDLALLQQGAGLAIEESVKIDHPHWLFDTGSLQTVLKGLSTVVPNKDEAIARAVRVSYRGGYVFFRVNSGDSSAQAATKILNEQKPLEGSFIVDFYVLWNVVRNSGNRVAIFQENGLLKVTVFGGTIEFDVFSFDENFYNQAEFVDQWVIGKDKLSLVSETFLPYILRGAQSMALSVRPDDRRAVVSQGLYLSNFMSSIFSQMNFPIKEVSFRAMDLEMIYQMFLGEKEISFYSVGESLVFVSGYKVLKIPRIDATDLISARAIVESFVKMFSATIPCDLINKIVSLLKSIVGNSGTIKILCKDGDITLLGRTRSGKNLQFKIGEIDKSCTEEMVVPTAVLGSLSSMYKKSSVLNLVVGKDKKFAFESDTSKVLLGSVL